VIESQVDWLTVSAHGNNAAARMLDLALGLAEEQRKRGARRRSWRLQGYEGHHQGAVEWGQRDAQSTILRLIGDAADTYLDVALSCADAVTRVDIATTWRAAPPDPHIGRNSYALAEAYRKSNPQAARPSFVGDADGGFTCYIGSRESDRFFRIYNKEAECKAKGDDEGLDRYRACWRYELEAKASLAAQLATVVAAQEDRANYVQDYIVSFLEARGVTTPFLASSPRALLSGFRRRSDAESRIRHLSRNVRPTVDWLRAEGKLDAARRALGLD
jgi:DNA relaxase NicK